MKQQDYKELIRKLKDRVFKEHKISLNGYFISFGSHYGKLNSNIREYYILYEESLKCKELNKSGKRNTDQIIEDVFPFLKDNRFKNFTWDDTDVKLTVSKYFSGVKRNLFGVLFSFEVDESEMN